MPPSTNSGIRTSAEGLSYIPASKRADGTTRKQIRVRPGFTPQEDVETYKSKNAEAWKNRGSGGVPGALSVEQDEPLPETKSKNAKRREAARKRQTAESLVETANDLVDSLGKVDIVLENAVKDVTGCDKDLAALDDALELENQKKVRNLLKKLSGVQDLQARKAAGEKLSPDQLMKIGREQEILRDLKKCGHQQNIVGANEDVSEPTTNGTG